MAGLINYLLPAVRKVNDITQIIYGIANHVDDLNEVMPNNSALNYIDHLMTKFPRELNKGKLHIISVFDLLTQPAADFWIFQQNMGGNNLNGGYAYHLETVRNYREYKYQTVDTSSLRFLSILGKEAETLRNSESLEGYLNNRINIPNSYDFFTNVSVS